MADTTNNTKSVLKLVATTSSKIRNLTIADGQLVFLYDIGRIAFDYKGTRVFYNQIVELESEVVRQSLENPLNGYYFILGSGRLWAYKDEWIPITEKPESVLFVGDENLFPELGQEDKLYINKSRQDISIWDDESDKYIKVANYTNEATLEDIENLF